MFYPPCVSSNYIPEKQRAEIEELRRHITHGHIQEVNPRTGVKRSCPLPTTAPSSSEGNVVDSSPSSEINPPEKKKKPAAPTKKSGRNAAVKNDSSTQPTATRLSGPSETSPCAQGISSFMESNMQSPASSGQNLSKSRKRNILSSTSNPDPSHATKMKKTSSYARKRAGTSKENLENSEPSEAICCNICKQGDLEYHVSNRFCHKSTECRIQAGDEYFEAASKTFCKPCFEKTSYKRCKKFTHRNQATEKMLQCRTCKKHFHKVCVLFLGDHDMYVCSACQEPSPRKSVEDIPGTDQSKWMEKDVNDDLWRTQSQETAEKHHIFIRTMNSSRAKADMKDQIPQEYLKEFEKMYGDKFEYNERTICAFQKIDGTDVLFFVMFTQEYKDLLGKNWVIIDYLDSVPLCNPIDKKGEIFGTILNSYLAYMGLIGFTHAHFWAKPPKQGDDYIFHIHPAYQIFHGQIDLQNWYQKSLEIGKRKRKIADFHTSDAEYNSETIEQPTELHVFKDNVWAFMLDWAKWAVNEKRSKKEQKKLVPHEGFMAKLRMLMEKHGKEVFYIDLVKRNDEVANGDGELKHIVMGDRDKFLNECGDNHWEWFDLRAAKYSTAAVIDMYIKKMNKKTT
ncbi:unnamed protein product [Caenorhabditis brenneri]